MPQQRGGRLAGRRLGLGPHGIALLLAISIILPSHLPGGGSSQEEPHGAAAASAECVVLGEFLGSPDSLADFEGTPAELQRWVDLYESDCR